MAVLCDLVAEDFLRRTRPHREPRSRPIGHIRHGTYWALQAPRTPQEGRLIGDGIHGCKGCRDFLNPRGDDFRWFERTMRREDVGLWSGCMQIWFVIQFEENIQ